MILDVDQLDFDPLVSEEAFLPRHEQRPKPDPGEVENPQRLGLRDAHRINQTAAAKAAKTKANSHFFASQSKSATCWVFPDD